MKLLRNLICFVVSLALPVTIWSAPLRATAGAGMNTLKKVTNRSAAGAETQIRAIYGNLNPVQRRGFLAMVRLVCPRKYSVGIINDVPFGELANVANNLRFLEKWLPKSGIPGADIKKFYEAVDDLETWCKAQPNADEVLKRLGDSLRSLSQNPVNFHASNTVSGATEVLAISRLKQQGLQLDNIQPTAKDINSSLTGWQLRDARLSGGNGAETPLGRFFLEVKNLQFPRNMKQFEDGKTLRQAAAHFDRLYPPNGAHAAHITPDMLQNGTVDGIMWQINAPQLAGAGAWIENSLKSEIRSNLRRRLEAWNRAQSAATRRTTKQLEKIIEEYIQKRIRVKLS